MPSWRPRPFAIALLIGVFVGVWSRTQHGRRTRNPTFSSSWATTSAGRTSALTTRASCIRRRRTWMSWLVRACASPTTTPNRAAPPDARTSSLGELPIRTGMTTVGQAGATIGIPAEAPTIATALKAMGYETGQFGKNHLGDLNQFLPTVHGFDEYWGYLYHLDAMEDPFWHSYPPALKDVVGPRNLIHSFATTTDDPTVQPRWGKIGKQRIEDEGPLPPHPMPGIKYNMETSTKTSSITR